jgi:hypothetical protein
MTNSDDRDETAGRAKGRSPYAAADPASAPGGGARAGTSGSAKGKAKGAAREQAQKAKAAGREAGEQAAERAQSMTEQWRHTAADRVGTFARALHVTSEKLTEERQETVAGYFDSAAGSLDRVSATLHDRELPDLVDEAADFARRHPTVFFGGSVLVGVLLARFARSSAGRAGGGPVAERGQTAVTIEETETPMPAPGGTGGRPE